jgi:hypothetical protein
MVIMEVNSDWYLCMDHDHDFGSVDWEPSILCIRIS